MKKSPRDITRGDGLYVEWSGGATSMSSQFAKIVRNLEQELAQLLSSNEQLIKGSEEQEKLIREWTEKLNHRSVQIERSKCKLTGSICDKPESDGKNDKIDYKSHKDKKEKEVHREF